MTDLIDTTEMYLRTILELEEENIIPLRARISERLGHSGPTVSQTVARMERDGLVVVSGDRHLELTAKGRQKAVQVMRKHRLAERLLSDVIGLEWEYVHEEACRWEHVMSDRVEELLDARLGHPQRTPYGNPVHDTDGLRRGVEHAQHGNLVRLAADAGGSTEVQLEWVGEPLQADPAALASLRRNGVVPGTKLRVAIHGPSLLVQLEGADDQQGEVDLPHQLAVHLFGTALTPASSSGRRPVSRPVVAS